MNNYEQRIRELERLYQSLESAMRTLQQQAQQAQQQQFAVQLPAGGTN